MKIYFTYILHCSDDSYYVGFTNNVRRRFLEHSSGYNPKSYTAQRLPVKLVYYEIYLKPMEGILREN